MFIPTCKVKVLASDVTTDDFGDDADNYKAVARNVSAHIYERRGIYFDGTDSRELDVLNYHVILPAGTEIEKGYRLVVEGQDTTYYVEHVKEVHSFIGGTPKRALLRRIA